jgi:hypothetical protein
VTANRPLVCLRCGFTNVPGDQFCGSCGAFLEWEGEQLASDVPPVTTASDVPPVTTASDVPPVTTPHPGPIGQATDTQPVSQGAQGLVRCPACGIANAASRTFCQSCGSKLAEAGRVAPVSKDQIAAAVSAPNRPVTVTTTTIQSARPDPRDGSSGGGVLKWIVIMAIIGLLVGVGIVIAGSMLRGTGPDSGATAAPPSGAAQASPITSDAPPASEAPPSDAPTPEPTQGPKAEPLALLGASASSVVGDLPKFQPTMAIDGNPDTCWQEGSQREKGEWIEVVFSSSKVTAVILTNGYNASNALYKGNRRLKDIEIRVGNAAPETVRLKDTGDPQKIDVKNVSGAVVVRITILSTYPSVATSVAGTPFDDAALGEIVVMGIPGS